MDKRQFLKVSSALCLGGAVLPFSLTSCQKTQKTPKKVGIQTYSLAQELMEDLPGGLLRLSQMGYNDLELYNFNLQTGMFGGSRPSTTDVTPETYKSMADDAGLAISGCHVNPSTRIYTKENEASLLEYWKNICGKLSPMGLKYIIQPSMPTITTLEQAQEAAEMLNKIGGVIKSEGLRFAYHNNSGEFQRVLSQEQREQAQNPGQGMARNRGTFIQKVLMDGTDPSLVEFELDVYWAAMGQQDPVAWMEDYPGRFTLLHIQDVFVIGKSGLMNFENIFKAAYQSGMTAYYLDMNRDRRTGRNQFSGVEESARFFLESDFVL